MDFNAVSFTQLVIFYLYCCTLSILCVLNKIPVTKSVKTMANQY